MRQLLRLLPILVVSAMACAQENQFQADVRGETTRFKESCLQLSFKAAAGCAQVLFTDHPLHIAVGSIAPQNGFGAGPALVGHWTPNESLRTSWNADAIASINGSWRAGAYFKMIHTPVKSIGVVTDGSSVASHPGKTTNPVYNLYVQSISLNKLYFFGLGPSTRREDRTAFGMTQTIVGVNAIVPVVQRFDIALLGEANGRFVSIRGNHHEKMPSIEERYSEASAPGLASQPAFAQFGEGVRVKPVFLGDHLQLNYLAQFQQFVAGDSHYSFRRLNFDLGHTLPIYKNSGAYGERATNGPDECALAPGAKCPSMLTRNRQGTVGVRLFISQSFASSKSVVPFYFQPTLGGSDVNGSSVLSSFDDYRFRAPNALWLRESLEHSIWGPLGFTFTADQGKVGLNRGDISFDHLKHSFAAGLTLRAGGLPMVNLLFAWGGGEGNHTIANINTSLLGGSARPPLY